MALFAVLVLVAYLAAALIARSAPFATSPTLPYVVSLDLTAGVVVVGWVLLVRMAHAPRVTLAPLFLISIAIASLVLPPDRRGLLGEIGLVAQMIELAVLAFGGWMLVRVIRRAARPAGGPDRDLLMSLHDAIAVELGPRVAGVLATELALVAYAVGGWFRRPTLVGGARSFTYLRAWTPLLAGLIVLLAVETLGVHLLVSLASPTIAWALSAVSSYGVLWLIGDAQAARHRPILVDSERLLVRVGLRWTVGIPRAAILEVRPARSADSGATRKPLIASLDGNPNVRLSLAAPVVARGPLGITRSATEIMVGVDDPDAFISALNVGS